MFTALRIVRGVVRLLAQWTGYAIYRPSLRALGRGVRFGRSIYIGSPGRVSLGDGVHIADRCIFGSELASGALTVGRGVDFNDGCHIDFSGGLEIGEACLFSTGVILYSHDHGHDPRAEPQGLSKVIGRDVWVGARAIIMHSCRSIGDNAVIGAGAIVVKDVPANTIVAGNPARPLTRARPRDEAA